MFTPERHRQGEVVRVRVQLSKYLVTYLVCTGVFLTIFLRVPQELGNTHRVVGRKGLGLGEDAGKGF